MTRYLATTLISGIVVLLVLALAAPALVGLYLAREHERLLAAVDLPGTAQLEIVNFDRGWFNSRMRVRISLGECDQPDCGVVFDSIIHHGPLALGAPNAEGGLLVRAVVETRLDLDKLFAGIGVQPELPTLTVVTRLPLTGGVFAQASLPAMKLRLDGGDAARLEAGPLSATLHMPPGGQPVLDVEWPRFSVVTKHGGQFSFLRLNARFIGGPSGWQTYQFAVDNAEYATAGGHGFALYGLRLDAVAEAGGSDLALRLSRLSARGNEYGPFLVRGHLQLESGSPIPPLASLLQAMAVSAGPAAALLRTQPHLSLDRILLSTPNGDVRGTLTLRVEAGTASGGELLSALQGRAELLVPGVLMENVTAAVMRHRHPEQPPPTPARVEKAIAGWLEHGFITYRDGYNAYGIKVTVNGRDLIVNGRKLENWPALLALVPFDQNGGPEADLGGDAASQ